MQNGTLPSSLSLKPKVIDIPVSEYEFPDQVRKGPLLAGYYTWNSMQTYDFNGYPSDTRGDNWD